MRGLLCVLLLLLCSGQALAQRSILLLHSYHHGYRWTQNVADGMEAVLNRELPDAELFVEEMDTKRHDPALAFPRLVQFYQEKYAGHHFDLVLSSDDNALDFLLSYGEKLFPGTPVVFCGINHFDAERLKGQRNITGVVEDKNFAGNLELALGLHPDTRQVALVGDRTPSSQANLQRFRSIAPDFADQLEFIELVGLSTRELQQALQELPAATVVFNCDFIQAAEGRYYELDESNALISRNSKGPVYVFNDDRIMGGVLGGLVLSGRQQGETAAELALRILHGERAADIAVIQARSGTYIFDYRVLQRFGIDPAKLPPDSRLVNAPPAVNAAHRRQLIVAAALAALFAGLTLWLAIALLDRRRSNRELHRNKGTLNAMLGSISDPMSMMDRDLTILWANETAQSIHGKGIIGEKCYRIFHGLNQPCPGLCPVLQAFENGRSHEKETEITDHAGQIRHMLCTANVALRGEDGRAEAVLEICRDITVMKQALKDLHLSKCAIDTSITPYAMGSLDGRLSYANRAFLDLWGYNREEDILGRPLDFFHERPEEVAQAVSQITEKGFWQGEIKSRRRDGSFFIAEVHAHMATDPAGTPLCLTGSFIDVTDKRHSKREMLRLAYFDALTGLPNRALLADHMDLAFSQSRRDGKHVAVLLLDLDNFKQINDTLGHAKGDLLLMQVVERLQSSLRKCDTLARWGGDEFVLLITGMRDELATAAVAGKILAALGELPFELDGSEIFTTASAGIALFPRDGSDGETLLQHADTAMYEAKKSGRNGYSFFSQHIHQKAKARQRLESNMRKALRQDEFFLVYHPQFDLRSGRPVGVEALLRWHSKELGMIPPGRFIPIAEDTGLIHPLGEWILRTACRQAVAWQNPTRPLRLAVNLSVSQLRQADLVPFIDSLLEETGFPPHLLELEVTESIFMEEMESAKRVLKQLRKRGIQIAMDDFGTGYSSLSYLKHMPIDRIKIAQEFVRDTPGDPDDVAIVETIITIANRLGLQQIAEGVETREQLEFLRHQGCDQMQGYYFARPMTAEELILFLQKTQQEGYTLYPASL